jgi:hypothetical protein
MKVGNNKDDKGSGGLYLREGGVSVKIPNVLSLTNSIES